MRRVFLWAARNRWLKDRLPRMRFMRRAVRRFMPGETLAAALDAAGPLQAAGSRRMYTRLGENLEDLAEADEVAAHYVDVLDQIVARGIRGEISVKPTQLGLDLDPEVCFRHLVRLAEHAAARDSYLWIDMEGSAYVEATIALYERLRAVQPRTGRLPPGLPAPDRRGYRTPPTARSRPSAWSRAPTTSPIRSPTPTGAASTPASLGWPSGSCSTGVGGRSGLDWAPMT